MQLFFLNRVISGHIDLVEEMGGRGTQIPVKQRIIDRLTPQTSPP